MAEVERSWSRRVMAQQDAPRRYATDADRDGDWNGVVADDAVVDEAWAALREEQEFTDRLVASVPDLGFIREVADGRRISLREVLLHLIEEYARHNGHADLIRGASTVGSANSTRHVAAVFGIRRYRTRRAGDGGPGRSALSAVLFGIPGTASRFARAPPRSGRVDANLESSTCPNRRARAKWSKPSCGESRTSGGMSSTGSTPTMRSSSIPSRCQLR